MNPTLLPASWALVSIEEVADINPKSFSPVPMASKQSVHFVPMSAVAEEFGGIDISGTRPLGDVQKGYTAFTSNDVLFAKITPCMENGKLAVVPELPEHIGYGSTEFHVLRTNAATTAMWLAHFLSQPEFRRTARQHMTGSAGQLRVSTPWLAAAKIPIPPFKEQARIVEKLEELLSDLDAGVAELKATQKKLIQYRQSLLKAAVDGALTAEWRKHNKPKETGSQLLERILKERRARWEEKQLAKFKERGKSALPKDWQTKYTEPVNPGVTDLPELPEGWVWASLDQLVGMIRNGLSQKPSTEENGYPILRINAVRPLLVDLSEVRYLSIDDAEASGYLLEEGDLLATRYNGSVGLLGVLGVVRGLSRPTVYPDKLIRIKPVLSNCLGDWIEICAAVGESRRHIVSRVKTTAGQAGISGDDVRKMPIPLPPLDEQVLALDVVSTMVGESAAQGNLIGSSISLSAAQRRNILKAAFSGQLVPQDPNDEPASVLLERIRAERLTKAQPTIKRAVRRRG